MHDEVVRRVNRGVRWLLSYQEKIIVNFLRVGKTAGIIFEQVQWYDDCTE